VLCIGDRAAAIFAISTALITGFAGAANRPVPTLPKTSAVSTPSSHLRIRHSSQLTRGKKRQVFGALKQDSSDTNRIYRALVAGALRLVGSGRDLDLGPCDQACVSCVT
jgi:hypothetical protein